MKKKVLIVEDQYIEAHDIELMLRKGGYDVCGIARSVPIALEMVKTERPDFVLLDIFLKGKLTGIDLAKTLRKDNIAFIYVSANSNQETLAAAKTTEPYGFIVKPFRERDLLITLEIAQYRHEHSHETKYRRRAELIRYLEEMPTSIDDWKGTLLQIAKSIQQEIPFDCLAIGLDRRDTIANIATVFLRIGFDEYQTLSLQGLLTVAGITKDELMTMHAATDEQTVTTFLNNENFEKLAEKSSLHTLFSETFHARSLLTLLLQPAGGETFSFRFYSRRSDAYNAEHIAALQDMQQTLTGKIEQMFCTGTTVPNSNVKKSERSQVSGAKIPKFEGIIGNSHLLLNVFDHVARVAPFDTTVLITGESGTGKEKIADCIHNLSHRKGKPLIKLNCAALPPTLIESELFGHEKGSFTGASDRQIGRFEQANGGTIFLDEIGEMPVELQVKLLRVLQEKEITPIGSRTNIKVNVRVIAATNRNLEKEVAERRFRLDLYYRLNVFPIALPSLRDRPEDIPALVDDFINHYSVKAGRRITGISDTALKNMMAYSWPGNIRELENVIERSVVLARGTVIEDFSMPGNPQNDIPTNAYADRMKTIHENEREYIIQVLKKCNGRIWGAGGAAEVLNIPPTTLKSKMKKLGIRKENAQ